MPAKTPSWREDIVVTAYLSGATLKQAGGLIGQTKTSAKRIIERRGAETRNKSEATKKAVDEGKVPACTTEGQRRYPVNEDFFDDIDTEEKAYWLGFLVADGHVDDDDTLFLKLQARDRTHVEKLRNALSPERPIYDYDGYGDKGTPYVHLEIRSKPLCEALAEHGVVPRKAHTVTPPDLPEELMRHFWRGVVDGDGSLSQYTKRSGEKADGSRYEYETWDIKLGGNEHIVSAFVDRMNGLTGSTRGYYFKDGCYRVTYDGRMSKQIILFLYRDSQVSLRRKLQKAKKATGEDL